MILSLCPFCFETYYTNVIVYVHPKYMFRKKNTLFVFIQTYPTCMHCIKLKKKFSFVMVNIHSRYLICVRNRFFFYYKNLNLYKTYWWCHNSSRYKSVNLHDVKFRFSRDEILASRQNYAGTCSDSFSHISPCFRVIIKKYH